MQNIQENNTLKLLVCESDTRLLKRLKSWIKAMGHEVTVSSDGLESLKLYNTNIADILIVSQKIKVPILKISAIFE